jgi:hypothetical protein
LSRLNEGMLESLLFGASLRPVSGSIVIRAEFFPACDILPPPDRCVDFSLKPITK